MIVLIAPIDDVIAKPLQGLWQSPTAVIRRFIFILWDSHVVGEGRLLGMTRINTVRVLRPRC